MKKEFRGVYEAPEAEVFVVVQETTVCVSGEGTETVTTQGSSYDDSDFE